MVLVHIDLGSIENKDISTEELQKIYDRKISDPLFRAQLQCPNQACGHRGHFHIHQSRFRWITCKFGEYHLKVVQVECMECHKYTTILPSFSIPHRHEEVSDVIDFLRDESALTDEKNRLEQELRGKQEQLGKAMEARTAGEILLNQRKEEKRNGVKLGMRLNMMAHAMKLSQKVVSGYIGKSRKELHDAVKEARWHFCAAKKNVSEIENEIRLIKEEVSANKCQLKKLRSPSTSYKSVSGRSKKKLLDAYHSFFEEFLKSRTSGSCCLFDNWPAIVKDCVECLGRGFEQLRPICIKTGPFIACCQFPA